jgi:hypothetical protein
MLMQSWRYNGAAKVSNSAILSSSWFGPSSRPRQRSRSLTWCPRHSREQSEIPRDHSQGACRQRQGRDGTGPCSPVEITVAELAAKYLPYAETYYTKQGVATSQTAIIRLATNVLLGKFSHLEARAPRRTGCGCDDPRPRIVRLDPAASAKTSVGPAAVGEYSIVHQIIAPEFGLAVERLLTVRRLRLSSWMTCSVVVLAFAG